MVQLFWLFGLVLDYPISIHLMLWFNFFDFLLVSFHHPFQYILCYGSTYSSYLWLLVGYYFNTSYVMVQR